MRINVIAVECLADQHLQAEMREIILSIHYYMKSSKSKNGINFKKIPKEYILSTGHATMWYNKFGYILNRYHLLLKEMKLRGYKTEAIEEKFLPLFEENIPTFLRNDYSATLKDFDINLERILTRIKSKYTENKPNFYKLNKKVLTYEEWVQYYNQVRTDFANSLKAVA